jgi:hypothetical protein
MIILGLDLSTINWSLFVYVLLSIVGLVYGTNEVYATGQARGVLFAIGTLLVLIYFGFRWFGSRIEKPKNWPPVINMCPDYLTYLPRITGCVDMLGVSKASGGLTITNPSETNTVLKTNTTKVFEYTSEDIRNAANADILKTICDRCQQAGLTWEGVWDGDTCVGIAKFEKDAAKKESCLISV